MNPLHSWLRFALNRNVKHVRLISNEWLCILPRFLLQNDLLVSLSLKNCGLATCSREIKCDSLRSLSLKFCNLGDEFVDKLLFGCPVLERLELVDCVGMKDLNIHHDRLKELVVDGSIVYIDFSGGMLRISAPYLSSLSLAGNIRSKCQLSNSSALVEAFFDLQFVSPWERLKEIHSYFKDALAGMTNVKKLTFGARSVEAISLVSIDNPHPSFSVSSCRSLVLHVHLDYSQLCALAWFLQSCPQLETLTVNIMPSKYSFGKTDNTWTSFCKSQHSEGYFSFLDHLKNVNVIGLVPNHLQTEYVTEVLQATQSFDHGKVLKNMFIQATQNDESMSDDHSFLKSHFELSQALLSFPRLSREAKIHLSVL